MADKKFSELKEKLEKDKAQLEEKKKNLRKLAEEGAKSKFNKIFNEIGTDNYDNNLVKAKSKQIVNEYHKNRKLNESQKNKDQFVIIPVELKYVIKHPAFKKLTMEVKNIWDMILLRGSDEVTKEGKETGEITLTCYVEINTSTNKITGIGMVKNLNFYCIHRPHDTKPIKTFMCVTKEGLTLNTQIKWNTNETKGALSFSDKSKKKVKNVGKQILKKVDKYSKTRKIIKY